MKKITFLILLFITSLTYGQTVLSEDFEGGLTLPTVSGWTTEDLVAPPNGEIWTIDDTGELGGFISPNSFIYDFGEASGNYATFNSDGYGDNLLAEESTLTSPVFSCATLTDVTLSFNHIFGAGFAGAGFVEVFDGTSWVLVDTYGPANDFGLKSFNVTTELAGIANAQVRFRWTGDFSLAWAVDNISVFQCTVSAPNAPITPNPADTATGVVLNLDTDFDDDGIIDTDYEFTWEPDLTGEPTDSYVFNFGTDATVSGVNAATGSNDGFTIFNLDYGITYFWRVDAVNCAGTTIGTLWSFTTEDCLDAAPGPVTTPNIADGASAVPIQGPNGSIELSWTDGPGGTPVSYVLNIGESDPPVDAVLVNVSNPAGISGFAVNTEYFWRVDAVTCAGTTQGPVWSFTTDTTLGTEDLVIETFKVSPNPTSGVLNIKTTLEIDNVVVTNLLGQQVAKFNRNSISNNSVNLSELSQGLYMVTVTAGDKTETFKVNKK